MPLLRTVLHLLLAMVLVINGAAGLAMAAGMASHGMDHAVEPLAIPEPHGSCHDSTVPSAARAGDDVPAEAADCCADGRCACACVHHATPVLSSFLPMTALAVWPPVAAVDVAAAPSEPASPDLRPPIEAMF